jgi:hypothetical protein
MFDIVIPKEFSILIVPLIIVRPEMTAYSEVV